MTNNNLTWLSDWYQSNCNGDWEHNYGVKIETIDNPGWFITIDLNDTISNVNPIPWIFVEKSAADWDGYKLVGGQFEASGDPSKMEFLIGLFRNIIEKDTSNGRTE
jgi:Immunity protein 53